MDYSAYPSVNVEKSIPIPPSPLINKKSYALAIVYGIVNAIMCVPVLYGYALIIFGSSVYSPFMPALSKLVLFSSAVHQCCFISLSSLSFAIGQVQDAGLIFLSKITAIIALKLRGESAEVVVSTTLFVTALSTAMLGICLVVVGKLKLARFVSYLPMPVVGGYLAFIGFFCLEAGLSLSTGTSFQALKDWGQLKDAYTLLLCTPGLLAGALFSFVSRRFDHFAALPGSMILVVALFYIALGMSGYNLKTARLYGLVGEEREAAAVSDVIGLFKFDLVQWDVVPHVVLVWLAMVVVVAFSSSLDVAAIEMDMGEPLETNNELQVVGWSNVISGFTGGFPGSYIFSNTIFTYRTHCRSRLCGWIVMFSELAVFFMPVDPLMYVPLFFFSSTLTFIAWELMIEWFIEVRHKLLWHEYLILLATFCSIIIFGLNTGLLAGIALSLIDFVVSYASESMHTMQRVYKRSRVVRPASQRRVLAVYRDKILCMELRGEIFFGSATHVLAEVKDALGLSTKPTEAENKNNETTLSNRFERILHLFQRTFKKLFNRLCTPVPCSKSTDSTEPLIEHKNFPRQTRAKSMDIQKNDYHSLSLAHSKSAEKIFGEIDSQYGMQKKVHRGDYPFQVSPENMNIPDVPSFIIFDCSSLTKLDATSARTCFMQLQRLSVNHGFCIAYARLTPEMEALLDAHGALDGDRIGVYPTVYAALAWCETTLIKAATRHSDEAWQFNHFNRSLSFRSDSDTAELSLAEIIRFILELPETDTEINNIIHYCTHKHFHQGDVVFEVGSKASFFCVLLEGYVALSAPALTKTRRVLRRPSLISESDGRTREEVLLGRGAIFGYVDFYLDQDFSFSAHITSNRATVCFFTRDQIDLMAERHPRICMLLERSVIKQSAMELSNFSV